MDANEYWIRLEETGWLEPLAPEARERLRAKLSSAFAKDPKYAFYALAATSFDPECIEGAGPTERCSYHDVIRQLAAHSRGLFEPVELHDELDENAEAARVSFEHRGERFAVAVRWTDGWFQEPVLDLVNAAIALTGAEERFIYMPSCDQTLSLALVSPSVYDAAVGAELIPRDDLFDDD